MLRRTGMALALLTTALLGPVTVAHADMAGSPVVVFAWGANDHGQLGNGTLADSSLPVPVLLPGDFEPLYLARSTGGAAYALGEDGRVFAWGANDRGQLGIGNQDDASVPVQVPFPDGFQASFVIATSSDNAAAGEQSDAYAVGHTPDGQSRIYAWGSNAYGQLGDGTTTGSDLPVAVTFPSMPDGTAVVPRFIRGGQTGTVYASTTDGGFYAWGRGTSGQLGDGTTTDSPVPVRVASPPGVTFTDVTPGFLCAYAQDSAGDLYSWGNAGNQLLGYPATADVLRPRAVGMVLPVGTLAVGAAGAAYAVSGTSSDDLAIYAWGDYVPGLGHADVPTKVTLPAGVRAERVVQTGFAAYATTTDGVYAWGSNPRGALGLGPDAPSYVPRPTRVPLTGLTELPSQSNDLQDSMSEYLYVSNGDHKLYAWGANDRGQLGNGSTTDSSLPVQVSLPDESAFDAADFGDGSAYVIGSIFHPTAPQFSSGRPRDGTVGDPYSETFRATSLPPPSYSVTAGTLPPGLTLNPLSGSLSGVPTTPGTYSFTVQAANMAGVATTTVTVSVTAPAPPVSPPVPIVGTSARVTSMAPAFGPSRGGVSLTLTGNGLDRVTAVTVGGRSARITLRRANTLRLVLPAGTGHAPVRLESAAGVVLAGTFAYLTTPGVTTLSLKGRAVVVHGFGFTRTATVLFGRRRARIVTIVDPMTLVVAPPRGTGTVDVTVHTGRGTSPRSSADRYTYRR